MRLNPQWNWKRILLNGLTKRKKTTNYRDLNTDRSDEQDDGSDSDDSESTE